MKGCRRTVMLFALGAAAASGTSATAGAETTMANAKPLPAVDPFVGTASGAADFGTGGGAGSTFPGAVLPGGMVQFSPDTLPGTDNFGGGYSYGDHRLRGFSLTHFSGGGCAGFGNVPLLPVASAVTASPAIPGSSDILSRYIPDFDHRHERAGPGAYSVTLNPNGAAPIATELTATARTGDARLRFSGGRTGSVLVGAGGSNLADYGAAVHVTPARREISGTVQSGNFCFQPTKYRIYFVARFDRPFAASGTWQSASLQPGGRSAAAENPTAFALKPFPGGPKSIPGDPSSGVQVGAYASFDLARARRVEVKVGVSFTSLSEARRNLDAEAAARPFNALRRAAARAWRTQLSKISVSGGAPRARALLYTALYHAMIEPSTVSDADGTYPGMDGLVHRLRPGAVQYSDISGWDIYRTQVPLLAALDPHRASDVAASLVRDAQQSGCLPRWPYAGEQTNIMTGDPADGIIASAFAFGARAFDARSALRFMIAGASHPCHSANGDYTEREGVSELLRLGYLPYELNIDVTGHSVGDRTRVWGTAATTLEDAVADSAIGDLAAALDQRGTARRFRARGGNWRRLFDPVTGYIRPRLRSGAWLTPFSPESMNGFVEGNAAQYSWFVPQDPGRLVTAMGGSGRVRRRLDGFFAQLNAGPQRPFAFLGNEPSLGVPWLYDWVGQPARASDVVRRALLGLYALTPGGMPGNDDGGTMSAWWVFGALGLYPATPGSGILAMSSPLFAHAVLHLPHARLQIDALGLSPARRYIQAARLDGRPLRVSRLNFASLASGSHLLTLRMGADRTSRWADRIGRAP